MTHPTPRAPQVKRMFAKENQHSPIVLVRSHWHSNKAPSFSLVRVDGFFFLFFILKHQEGTQQTPHFCVASLGWGGSGGGCQLSQTWLIPGG